MDTVHTKETPVCCQGYPILSIVFLHVFVADILALKVKKNDQILGIKPSKYSSEF